MNTTLREQLEESQERVKQLTQFAIEQSKVITELAQIAERHDSSFYQGSPLGSRVALMAIKRPSCMDEYSIDTVNRELILTGSNLYKAASFMEQASREEIAGTGAFKDGINWVNTEVRELQGKKDG